MEFFIFLFIIIMIIILFIFFIILFPLAWVLIWGFSRGGGSALGDFLEYCGGVDRVLMYRGLKMSLLKQCV